jgi:hypothetical protein
MTSTTSESRCFITLSPDPCTVRFVRAVLSERLKICLPPAAQDKSDETVTGRALTPHPIRLNQQDRNTCRSAQKKITQQWSVDPGSDALVEMLAGEPRSWPPAS